MTYKEISHNDINHFCSIVDASNVLIGDDDKQNYSHDYTEDLVFMPSVVLLPGNAQQVQQIMQYCHTNHIAVTPRAAGTGLSGGALPIMGGVLLSVEKMNKIIQIDEQNLQATVEPGVINQELRSAVEAVGLFYPPDPASRGSCMLGGNVAENAGGPKAVKYGVTKDYILNLEVVLPNGDIIWTGANVLKNSTGYNLTQLMIGSEGTLGVITKIVVKLVPLPQRNMLMLVPFDNADNACKAVAAVFRAGITPSAMEFMERDAIDFTMQYVQWTMPISDNVQAHLIVEVDGNHEDILMKECEQIAEIMYGYKCEEILFAQSEQEKNNLWKLRRAAGEAVKAHSIYKEEDTVVPRASLPQLLKGVKDIGTKYGFKSVCYGHAGDGNLHVNIIKDNLTDAQWDNMLTPAIREIFVLCKALGGTISGEHGIGYVQKQYLDIAFTPIEIELQKKIKLLFDPHGILNPGKMFM